MNRLARCCARRARRRAPAAAAGSVEPQAAAAEGLHGRARTVGRQVERRQAPRRACRASRRAAPPGPRPVSHSRCQRAKSPYWMGSGGSGEGSPRGEGVVEGDQLAVHHPRGPAVGDDVVDVEQEEVEVGGRGAAARCGSAGRPRGRRGRPGRPRATRLGLGLAGGLRQRREVDHRQRAPSRLGERSAGPAGRRPRRRWRAAPRAGARSRSTARSRARGVQRPPQAQGRAHVEGRVARLHAVEEPEALLAEGERRRLRRPAGSGGRSGGGGSARPASLGGSIAAPARRASGASKSARSGQLDPEARRASRETSWVASSEWPPSVEEVVVAPRPRSTLEDLAPDRRELPLGAGRRRGVPGGGRRACGAKAGPARARRSSLPLGGQRQRGQRDEGGGDHGRRQARP